MLYFSHFSVSSGEVAFIIQSLYSFIIFSAFSVSGSCGGGWDKVADEKILSTACLPMEEPTPKENPSAIVLKKDGRCWTCGK